MPDLTPLRELAPQVPPPDLGDLARVARRRRRAAVGAASALVVAVVAVAAVGTALGRPDAADAPVAPAPTVTSPGEPPEPRSSTPPPDRTQGPFPTLSPEEIRHHPDAVRVRNTFPVTAAPGVAVRQWGVCLADCSRATQHQLGEYQEAFEVTDDDFASSTLYPSTGGESVSHVLDGWFLHRGELVDGRGRSRHVSSGPSTPVEQVAGPLTYASGGVAWLDLRTMQLHELEGDYWDWGGASDTWYWGSVYRVPDTKVLEQGVAWQNPDGSYGVRMLPFDETDWSTQTLRSGIPGTMGAIEPGSTRLLHVSTDFGETWDVRVLPDRWGTGTSVPDDWRTWVDDWPTWPTP
jgi:hypothetical protein